MTPAPDQLPPHSVEAERAVLGCILLDPVNALDECQMRLRPALKPFYDPRHQLIYDAALALRAAGRPVDVQSVSTHLTGAGLLEQSGGLAALAALPDAVASAAQVSHYLDIVHQKAVLRTFIAKCAHWVGHAMTGEVPNAGRMVSDAAMELVTMCDQAEAVKPEKHIREHVLEVVDEIEAHYKRGSQQLPPGYLQSGLTYYDKVSGGIAPFDLVMLAGRPGAGKTTLAAEIIYRNTFKNNWTRKTGQVDDGGHPVWEDVSGGLPVGVFSLEMSGKSIARRLMFRLAEVSAGKFKQGYASKQDFARLTNAAGQLSGTNIWVDATPGQTIGQIAAKARRWHERYGIRLFVLDYLQLIRSTRRGENRNRELEEIVDQFVVLKQAMQVPWLVLAQMNRDIEKAEVFRVPQLSDMRDSGAIEQACDQAFFLYQPAPPKVKMTKEGEKRDKRADEEDLIAAVMEQKGIKDHTEFPARIDGYQAKNRDGATGNVKFLFQKNQFRFDDWHDWEALHETSLRNAGERRSVIAAAAGAVDDNFDDVVSGFPRKPS